MNQSGQYMKIAAGISLLFSLAYGIGLVICSFKTERDEGCSTFEKVAGFSLIGLAIIIFGLWMRETGRLGGTGGFGAQPAYY